MGKEEGIERVGGEEERMNLSHLKLLIRNMVLMGKKYIKVIAKMNSIHVHVQTACTMHCSSATG